MPSHVYDLLPRLNKSKEIIMIQNYGGMSGGADYLIYLYALKCGLNIASVYKMQMPENYTLTFTVPQFYLKGILKKADGRIDAIIDKIQNRNYEIPRKRAVKEAKYLKNKSVISLRMAIVSNAVSARQSVRRKIFPSVETA